jgi:hypothetical protein
VGRWIAERAKFAVPIVAVLSIVAVPLGPIAKWAIRPGPPIRKTVTLSILATGKAAGSVALTFRFERLAFDIGLRSIRRVRNGGGLPLKWGWLVRI